jgi:hypothetical protein
MSITVYVTKRFTNYTCTSLGYVFFCAVKKTKTYSIRYMSLPHCTSVSKSFRTELITKWTITINTHWEGTQRVIAAKLSRLTHKIAIQLHLMAELWHLQFSLQAASPETFGYTLVFQSGHFTLFCCLVWCLPLFESKELHNRWGCIRARHGWRNKLPGWAFYPV